MVLAPSFAAIEGAIGADPEVRDVKEVAARVNMPEPSAGLHLVVPDDRRSHQKATAAVHFPRECLGCGVLHGYGYFWNEVWASSQASRGLLSQP